MNKVLEKLDKEVTMNKEKYTDYDKLFSDLSNNNIDSLLIKQKKLEQIIIKQYIK